MVIVDNKYLVMVRQWQQLFYERNYAETDLSGQSGFRRDCQGLQDPRLASE